MRMAIYNTASGRIDRLISCPEDHAPYQVRAGESWLDVSDDTRVGDDTHYVRAGQIVSRQALTPALSVSGHRAVITPLPAGLNAHVMGQSVATDGQPLTLLFQEPGTYTVQIDGNVAYQSLTLEVIIDGNP